MHTTFSIFQLLGYTKLCLDQGHLFDLPRYFIWFLGDSDLSSRTVISSNPPSLQEAPFLSQAGFSYCLIELIMFRASSHSLGFVGFPGVCGLAGWWRTHRLQLSPLLLLGAYLLSWVLWGTSPHAITWNNSLLPHTVVFFCSFPVGWRIPGYHSFINNIWLHSRGVRNSYLMDSLHWQDLGEKKVSKDRKVTGDMNEEGDYLRRGDGWGMAGHGTFSR